LVVGVVVSEYLSKPPVGETSGERSSAGDRGRGLSEQRAGSGAVLEDDCRLESDFDVVALELTRSKPVCGPGREHRDRSVAGDRGVERDFESVVLFELDRRDVAERLMQALVVEPADVLDGRELELAAGAPHAVGDQLGLSSASPTVPIDASTSWSSSTCV